MVVEEKFYCVQGCQRISGYHTCYVLEYAIFLKKDEILLAIFFGGNS